MLRLTTLGATDLRDHLGHPVREVLVQPKRVALLVLLAMETRRGPVSRDRLVALFWPESDQEHARNALSQAVHHLRQALGADAITSHGANALEVPAASVWCDAAAFADALERGEGELALDLYRGEFCPSLFVAGAPDAEQWLENQRARLRLQAVAAARTLAERLAARGDQEAAARVARRGLSLRPDDEGEVRALLGLLDRAGDGAGALNAYREYTQRLLAELETEPALETRRIAEAIRRRREAEASSPDPIDTPLAPAASIPTQSVPSKSLRSALWRHRSAAAVAGIALVLAGGLGALTLARRSAAIAPSPRKTIAVFPFTVRGSSRLDYLHEGMVDLLSAKLEGTSGFHAIDPRSVVASVSRHDSTGGASAYATAAGRLGAGWYVTGDVVEIAGRIRLSGALHDPSRASRAIASATVSGDTTHLFELVDSLTGQILAGLVPGRDTALTRLAALTTNSLPALKAYLQGEQAMRAGRDGQAAEAFREAVALDSTFALALYRLALSSTWVVVPNMSTLNDIAAVAARAERNAHRLSPLVRDLMAGYRSYKELRIEESERLFRRITEGHPDNVEAWFLLGETHFHFNAIIGRSPGAARADFQRVLSLDPGNAHAILHLARLDAREGRLDELDSLAALYLSRYSGAERTLEIRMLVAAARDDHAALKALKRDTRSMDVIILESLLQGTLLYAQNLEASRDLAVAVSRGPMLLNSHEYERRVGATVTLAAGQWHRDAASAWFRDSTSASQWLETAALLAANPLVPLPRSAIAALRDSVRARTPYPVLGRPGYVVPFASGPDIQAYLAGLLSIRLGDSAAARQSLASLNAVPAGARGEVAAAMARTVRAALARQRGDVAGALAELNSLPEVWVAERYLCNWLNYERFMMGELLHAQGRDEEALGFYNSYPAGYDMPWVPLAHLRQAQIYQHAGNVERARFHYGRFVTLWQHADPELQPMVSAAREALAILGSESSTTSHRNP